MSFQLPPEFSREHACLVTPSGRLRATLYCAIFTRGVVFWNISQLLFHPSILCRLGASGGEQKVCHRKKMKRGKKGRRGRKSNDEAEVSNAQFLGDHEFKFRTIASLPTPRGRHLSSPVSHEMPAQSRGLSVLTLLFASLACFLTSTSLGFSPMATARERY